MFRDVVYLLLMIMAVLVGLLLPPLAEAAKIKIYPVIIDTDRARASINVVNEDADKPITLEAQAVVANAKHEIAVFPPVATLMPGERQVFRIILPGSDAIDQTQAWKVRIAEIGTKEFGADNSAPAGQLRNELAFEIPVFQSPKGAVAKLQREGNKVRNVGNRQAVITRIGDRNVHLYLLPGEAFDVAPGEPLFSLDREIIPVIEEP